MENGVPSCSLFFRTNQTDPRAWRATARERTTQGDRARGEREELTHHGGRGCPTGGKESSGSGIRVLFDFEPGMLVTSPHPLPKTQWPTCACRSLQRIGDCF